MANIYKDVIAPKCLKLKPLLKYVILRRFLMRQSNNRIKDINPFHILLHRLYNSLSLPTGLAQ